MRRAKLVKTFILELHSSLEHVAKVQFIKFCWPDWKPVIVFESSNVADPEVIPEVEQGLGKYAHPRRTTLNGNCNCGEGMSVSVKHSLMVSEHVSSNVVSNVAFRHLSPWFVFSESHV